MLLVFIMGGILDIIKRCNFIQLIILVQPVNFVLLLYIKKILSRKQTNTLTNT